MNRLLIDIGNSNIKWCWLSGKQFYEYDKCLNKPANYQEALGRLVKLRQPDAVMVSSVLLDEENRIIDEFMVKAGYPEPSWCKRVSDTRPEISTHYTDPDALGIDRYLAILAAYTQAQGAAIVVDAGTATTIDYVSSQGHHLGGVILPGFEMLYESFSTKIPRLRKIKLNFEIKSLNPFQLSTVGGLSHGVKYMWIGGISRVVTEMTQRFSERPTLFLTGGNTGLLQELLGIESIVDDQLVLKGLALQLDNH